MLSNDSYTQFSKKFIKQWKALPPKKQTKVIDAVDLFRKHPDTHKLRLHPLKGELAGIWSISADGDLRLHFRYHGEIVVFFIAVGSHSQLY